MPSGGFRHSPESRRKISEAGKGRVFSEETRKKISEANKGNKNSTGHIPSLESRKKMSKTMMGHSVSLETREKISKSGKGKHTGEKNPNWGKHPSEETLRRLSESHKGKKLSEETKNKLRIINIGKIFSEEHRRNMSLARKGKPNKKLVGRKVSDETKRKISEAQRGGKSYWWGKRGEGTPSWRGGINQKDIRLRDEIKRLFEYRQWRSDIFHRDEFKCQDCGIAGVYFHAHHINFFQNIINKYKINNINQAKECSELWDINNGKTLCVICHKKVHNKEGKR